MSKIQKIRDILDKKNPYGRFLVLFVVITFSIVTVMSFMTLPQQAPPPTEKTTHIDATPQRFIMMGDTGTGLAGQYNVAEEIEKHCQEKKDCTAVFILGDVVYEEGVSSINDVQFKTKFEQPYANIDLPFYILFGNHDYLGCRSCYLEYAEQSEKWVMPSSYYQQSFNDIATFYATDTEQFDSEQQAWLREAINASDTPLNIVLGHRPIISFESTKRGENWYGKDELQDVVCSQANFYISGHAHVLEDLGSPEGCYARLLVSGSGGAWPRSVDTNDQHQFYFEGNGFLSLFVSKHISTYTFYDSEGNELYHQEILEY